MISMAGHRDADHEASIQHLVSRTPELKQELLAFLKDRRIARELDEALAEWGGPVLTGDEGELAMFFDSFLLLYRLSDGRTPVERFVRSRGDLPRAEREMLLRWTATVESIFEVGELDGPALWTTNLVDELPYRVWSNMGLEGFAPLSPGAFTIMRLVPVLDEWMISGPGAVLGADQAEDVLKIAAKRALIHPESECHNPQHRERAQELQRERREMFVAHFGADQVIIPGRELHDRLAAYRAVVRSAAPVPEETLPSWLTRARTVGVIYDEVEGLRYYPGFGDVLAAFEGPEPPAHALQAVRAYVEDEAISPLPLLRCVRAFPDRADAVLAAALGRRAFSWERDGGALLRRYKPHFQDRPAALQASVVPERLIPYLPDEATGRPSDSGS